MQDPRQQEKLNTLLKVLSDTVSHSDIQEFLKMVLDVIKQTKASFDKTSTDNLQQVTAAVNKIEQLAQNHKDELDQLLEEKKQNANLDITKQVQKAYADAKEVMAQLQAIEVKDGKDGEDGEDGVSPDPDAIADQVLAKLPPPPATLTTEQIIEGINLLPLSAEFQIDASHIKNLPKEKGHLANAARYLTSLVDVSISSPANGQVLKYNSTTGTWQNDTGGSGSSPLTTKGDLWGYNTADARVPVGSNGQVLTADSTNALGVSWQNSTPSLIATTAIWIDGNRVDAYTADGSIGKPYKTWSAFVAGFNPTGLQGAMLFVTPFAYTEASSFSMPNISTTIWAGNSTLTINGGAGNITFPNAFDVYSLNIVGNFIQSDTSTTSIHNLVDGSVSGTFTISGLCNITDQVWNVGPITVNSGAIFNSIGSNMNCRIINSGIFHFPSSQISINDNSHFAIDSSAAGSVVQGSGTIVVNAGTGGGINCANGATSSPNAFGNITVIVGVGTPAHNAIYANTAVTVIDKVTCQDLAGTRYVPYGVALVSSTDAMIDNMGAYYDTNHSAGSSGYLLSSTGIATQWLQTVPSANGGTGLNSLTPYALLAGGTTSTGALQQVSGLGTAGQVLTSNGASALPTWQNSSAGFTNPMTTLGDLIYEDGTPTAVRLPGNTTATKNFLTQTGNGSISAAPVWSLLAISDLPSLSNGQLYIGNGSGVSAAALTAGTGITITNASGAITIAETASAAYCTGNTLSGAAAFTLNTLRYMGIIIDVTVTTSKVGFHIGTGDNSGDLYSVGIYNSAGTLVLHTAPASYTTSGDKTVNWVEGTVTLAPGKYYAAMTGNAATATLEYSSQPTFLGTTSYGTGTTGGAMPSSITPAADSFSFNSAVWILYLF